jgi:putative phage-type endonuclease
MGISFVCDLDTTTPAEWRKWRTTGIGGSDVGVIAGVSTYKDSSPYTIWAEKTGNGATGVDERFEPEWMRWGRLLEDPIAEEFTRRTGIEAYPFRQMIRSDEYPFMIANVDRLTGPVDEVDGVLEIKTTRFADQWEIGEDGAVTVPPAYLLQGQHYLAITTLDVVWFACLIGGQELRIAEVARNDALIGDLIAIEEDFWHKVETRTPPAADGSLGTLTALRRQWVPEPGKAAELDRLDGDALFAKRRHLESERKIVEDEIDEIDAAIMAALGDAEIGTVDGETVVTWRAAERVTLDSKAFKAQHPDLYKEFSRTTSVRTLRFPKMKEES